MSSIVQKIVPRDTTAGGVFEPDSATDVFCYQCDSGQYEWTAYVGTNPNGLGSEIFEATVITSPTPAMSVSNGWVYFLGHYPAGKRGSAEGGATGTTMIMQHAVVSSSDVVYFYLIKKDDAADTVQIKWDGELEDTLTSEGQYAEIDAQGNVTKGLYNNVAARKQFVEAVIARLQAVGVPV